MGKGRPRMDGDSLSPVKCFYGSGGQTHVQLLADEPERHAVVMPVHFDVIINVDPRLAPFGKLIRLLRQLQGSRPVYFLKEFPAGFLDLAHGALVEVF